MLNSTFPGRIAHRTAGNPLKGLGTEGNAPAYLEGLTLAKSISFHSLPRNRKRRLRDVGERIPTGQHVPVVLDGAGWHTSKELEVPAYLSLLRSFPCSPAQDPAETLFSVLKHCQFANGEFDRGEHVRQAVGEVWNGFILDT